MYKTQAVNSSETHSLVLLLSGQKLSFTTFFLLILKLAIPKAYPTMFAGCRTLIAGCRVLLAGCLLLLAGCQKAEIGEQKALFVSGIPWYDMQGDVLNAHGAGIWKEGNRYYLFGEYKNDTTNAFCGVSCYSSINLSDWHFHGISLPIQDSGRLGPQRVGERPKVMRCPATGQFIMYMHSDNLKYSDPCVVYATSDKILGPYCFRGPLLFESKIIKKWDMGVFQDRDGSGYLITHSGNLYRLSDDYKSIERQVVSNMTAACESPVIFRKDSIYYWLGSGLTGWERNDNYYFTATSLQGPWTARGLLAPQGTLTWNSQCTFVLPVQGDQDTCYLYMGDRWSHPRQGSAASYVWQPLQIENFSISLPDYKDCWTINTTGGLWHKSQLEGKIIQNDSLVVRHEGPWETCQTAAGTYESHCDQPNATLSFSFEGSRAGFYATADKDGGYAQIVLSDSLGNQVLSSIVDMYCQYPEYSLRFLSPVLPKGSYSLTIRIMGEHWYWITKSGKQWGSQGQAVSVDKFIVQP